MKNISILGCGWLGESLAVSLLKKGFLVKGSTTSQEKIESLRSKGIKPFIIDISKTQEITTFLNTDILVIAITSKELLAYKKLIKQIENSTLQKVIFISSTSVYERQNKIMTEEDVILKTPLSQIENVFIQNTFFETTVIRFAGLFGNERQPSNWFKNGREIPQPEGFVNLIHQEDCINIIYEIIKQNSWNQIFNACSNHHPTRREFYTKVKLNSGKEAPVFKVEKEYLWKIISSEKVQKTLNYTFVHDNLWTVLTLKKKIYFLKTHKKNQKQIK